MPAAPWMSSAPSARGSRPRSTDGSTTLRRCPSPRKHAGDLQVHTTFSDGSLTLPDMVEEARSVGRSYVAITDHSQTLAIANGMTPDDSPSRVG